MRSWLSSCCGGELQRCNRKRTRRIEDILEDLRTLATERQCCLVHLLRQLEKVDEHNRSAVILRKISQSNRSENGAAVQAVLMSVYRTLKLRGHDPLATITSALRTYLTDGHLPPLPIQSVADG